jgi:cobaltochelatase CobN
MKMTAIMMRAHIPLLKRGAESAGINLTFYSTNQLEKSPELAEEALTSMRESDVVLLSHTAESAWDRIDRELISIGERIPIISISHDPSYWIYSTVRPEIVTTCQDYFSRSGDENFANLMNYIRKEVFHEDIQVKPPQNVPWEGIYHPDAKETFSSTADYLAWYIPRKQDGYWVGVVFQRFNWVSRNLNVEETLIRTLEQGGMNVIPVFTNSTRDVSLGSKGLAGSITEYLLDQGKSRVDAVIKLNPYLIGSDTNEVYPATPSFEAGVHLLRRMNVPVFAPIVSTRMSLEEWRESAGLTDDTSFSVAMPEFEGVIEPILIGGSRSDNKGEHAREADPERCKKVTDRVKKWIDLAKKPVHERKVVIMLNNSPCMNADATIGGGAHLDSLESVARILQEMKTKGYTVTPPASGKELIETMIERKAKSEFRWTTVEDIVSSGGALMQMDMDTFMPYFRSLPEHIQEKITETYGEGPGKSMVLNNKILITGLSYGNAIVLVQPKRGCYGSRCDGEVCKILHDPLCPPPQQFLATYFWIEHIYKADVLVHVGTHGYLEFLPGKTLGLSGECYPDLTIGTIPFLYIYNADNPPEGTVAKRRGYATLVDHMQTVLMQGGLYEGLEELEQLLGQYESAKHDPARAHALQHLIMDAINDTNLSKDIHLDEEISFQDIVSRAHDALSKIRNTKIPSGMHTFGELPEGEKRYDFINAIIRFDSGDRPPRRAIARLMGFDLLELLTNQNKWSQEHGVSYGELLERIEAASVNFIRAVLEQPVPKFEEIFGHTLSEPDLEELGSIRARILDINSRVDASREIDSLLNGFAGGYIPSGPSGVISRGREDIMPTGRNFYSMDPYRVPSKASWIVGKRLAEKIIQKYQNEEGKYPENIGFFWLTSDIMSADGEMYSQLLALIGVEPVWQANGQVRSFTIIPLEQLGRPRIDITVRVSGIARDNFSNCIELLDEAVQAVANLDESPEMNYVKRHTLEKMAESTESFRDASFRIFCAQPGAYRSGVDLAVLASSWKTDADLADIFVYWCGYAYGKDVLGKAAHTQLASSLSTMSVTFNKVDNDKSDLLTCCGYYGTHGGLTAAARHYSGKETKAYYGDTREPENVEVRDLSDEVRRVVRTKLLNPKWIEGMKEHGYKGAADIMKRVVHTYGWEASTQEVDDWIFDDIANTFVNDAEMREFFEQNNPFALEEIARRLLEAEQRGLWDADEQTLEDLKNNYLQIESWMEDQVTEGDFQGGSIDILTQDDVAVWGDSMKGVLAKVHEKHPRPVGGVEKNP